MDKDIKNKPAHMDYFSHGEITGAVILDTRRAKDKGQYPIKYRVTYKKKAVYFKTGYNATVEEWEILKTSKTQAAREQRALIKSGFDNIEAHVKDLKDNFSFDGLFQRLGRGKVEKVSTLYEIKINNLIAEGKIGTADWYKYSLKSLNKYREGLTFKDITAGFLAKYEKWLLTPDENDKKKSFTTVSMYMRALQSMVNEGIKAGALPSNLYPFGSGRDKYKIPEENGRNLALSLAQIKEIRFAELKPNEQRSRDLWFFSYLCNGINFVDLLKLKFSDIHAHDNKTYISFYRQKTLSKTKKKQKIVARVTASMQEIIDKWGSTDKSPDNYIFPFMKPGLSPSEQQKIVKNVTRLVNDHMAKIGKALGLGNISTYTARHSYATVLKRSGTPIAYISETLGHSDLSTTKSYLDTFEQDESDKNAEKLESF